MTSMSSRAGAMPPRGAGQAVAPRALPSRVPGAQGPAFPIPPWKPGASGWAEPEPEVMERVRAALRRL